MVTMATIHALPSFGPQMDLKRATYKQVESRITATTLSVI